MEDKGSNHKQLRILTLNCWGIPFVSRDVKKRFSYIAKELATGKYDIVSLQEVWSQSDYEYVSKKVAEVLPHTIYFHSGVIGSGVCVFSKYPITDAFTHGYSLNGYMYMVHHGDWFGGKSACYCLIDHPKQPIHLFTTHLHAEYDPQDDIYLAHRTVQAFQLAQFINHLTSPSDCIIVCGDMNNKPSDTGYRVIKHLPDLIDTWDIASQGNDCHTCDVSTNFYTPRSKVENPLKGPVGAGKRIDYIFYRAPPHTIRCIEHTITMGKIPGEDLSYSDHEGVLATFNVDQEPSLEDVLEVDGEREHLKHLKQAQEEVMREVMNISQYGMNCISNGNLKKVLFAAVLAIFILLPIACSANYSSVFHILRPLGKILYLLRILCAMFLTGFLFYAIFNAREEHKVYRNVQNEIKLQMKYHKMKIN